MPKNTNKTKKTSVPIKMTLKFAKSQKAKEKYN